MASVGDGMVVGQDVPESPRIFGVFLAPSIAARLKKMCDGRGWHWLEISRAESFAELASRKPDVVVIPEAERELLGRALPMGTRRAFRVLLIDTEDQHPVGDWLEVGDKYVAASADDSVIAAALDELVAKGTIESVLRRVDFRARRLAGDENAQWVRSRMGIVGVVNVSAAASSKAVKEEIERSIRKAYALLDNLPEDELSLEDLWNLLLFVSVPWTQEEASAEDEIIAVLNEAVENTSGSRKIILWKDKSLIDHLGPMGRRGTLWLPSSPDPLRDALAATVRDSGEMDALEALFKARISEADLDEIIRVLGRKT